MLFFAKNTSQKLLYTHALCVNFSLESHVAVQAFVLTYLSFWLHPETNLSLIVLREYHSLLCQNYSYSPRLIKIVVVLLLDRLRLAATATHNHANQKSKARPEIDEPRFDARGQQLWLILHDHNSPVIKSLNIVLH